MNLKDKRPATNPRSALELRQKAEEQFRERESLASGNNDELPPEALKTILHELRVHQIELEMQNEELRAAQADLAATRAHYFELYELAPVGYVTISGAGLIQEANLTAATLLGVERSAMMNKPVSRFILKEDQDIYYKMRNQLMETREPQACELRMVKPDGTAIWTHLATTVSQDEDKEPICRFIFNDITERKRMETALHDAEKIATEKSSALVSESEARYAQLAELNSTVTWEVDAQGLFTYVSQVSETVFGYRPDELMGEMHFYDLHPESVREEFKASAFTIFAQKQRFVSFVNAIETKDGRQGWVSTNGTPIVNAEGTLCGYRGSDTDITERKAMEVRLNESLVAANAANIAKSEFLGIMSHELRTPLNGVLGFTELLSYTPLDSKQNGYAEKISKCGEHLLAVVSGILDFSSIDAGTLALHVEPLAVADIVKTAEATVRKTAAEKGLELRCEVAADVPAQITGDATRLRQILINLLSNAVKFTQSGSVVLRIAPDAEGRFLEFSIEDTGIGISSEAIGFLFKPFTQADSTSTQAFGGTGLGLAISKRLAEALGGTITVVSTPGSGSTFTFHLPLDSSAGGKASVPSHLFIGADGASPSSPIAETSMPSEGHLVLVVDDDQASSVLAGKMLQSLGYRAEFAGDGAEALKAFVPGKFSAILMDVSMPVLGGLEATKILRMIEASAGGRVPVIALTANVMPGDRERCLAAGMDDFLSKPFGKADLAVKLAGAAYQERSL